MKTWSKNWSGRGVAMMDFMEKSSIPKKANPDKEINDMLKQLVLEYPDNEFFKSLEKYRKKKPFSVKQVGCIKKNFTAKIDNKKSGRIINNDVGL
jgi:hypothetical protein